VPTSRRRRADEISSSDPGLTPYLLAFAACAVIVGLLMMAGWLFWRLDTTGERIAFVGLLAFVAFASAYVTRTVSR
jgi:hypothetical protein